MFDRSATAALQPFIDPLARRLVRAGVGANLLTGLGFGVGMIASLLIANSLYYTGALFIFLSRLCDGLDGAVARLTTPTDQGGFLDIALDFAFYASIPLAFAVADPQRNALPSAVLLAAFIGTGSSFLAFAAIAAKRGMSSTAYPNKSFYFLGGLTEATETLACFTAMCLWPHHFAPLAYGFAALCAVTWGTRLWWGWRAFK